MADLLATLAQLLGQREEEQPNLNPSAPNTTPGTRGLFRRRPVGRPSGAYEDVAPMPPDGGRMAVPQPPQPQAPPSYNFPFPMGAAPMPQIPVASGPQAPHVSVMHASNPGAYNDFPSYNRAIDTYYDPQRRSGPHIRSDYGGDPQTSRAPFVRHGVEPPDAPMRNQPAPLSMEDEAWQAARMRAHETIAAYRREQLDRLPRPGRPLIAQAWSAPAPRNRRDDR